MFADRREAGRSLASQLHFEIDPIVLGIARGGVIVAQAIAEELHAPLDVVVVRKVGHPLQPELALGAVCASGESVVTAYAGEYVPGALSALVDEQIARARALEASLRGGFSPLDIGARTVILVDDGIATSATMECAIAHARTAGAARVVCAAPVAPVESAAYLERLCERLVVLVAARERDFAVGRYYRDFREVTDRQVLDVVSRFRMT